MQSIWLLPDHVNMTEQRAKRSFVCFVRLEAIRYGWRACAGARNQLFLLFAARNLIAF